ncbi:hypothetical protein [Streptomyces sp. NPDC092903]|uniref:hypothetical protein n=1 Tax=Streptomyces sp. NPDC092903 TaxID=3366017 RepID=UPI0037F666E4
MTWPRTAGETVEDLHQQAARHMAEIDSPEERWTLAMRDVATLHGVPPIDLGGFAAYTLAT